MKSVLIVVLFVTALFSKECYFNKVNKVCYYKYFDRANIYKAKAFENYYIDKNRRIYTFDKTIEVKFNSIGAIFTILNDFELEFVDKINKETYLFKVSDRRDLFPTISKLNRLETVMKAQPHKTRKYTNTYINRKQAAKRERLEAVLEEAQERLDNKGKAKVEKKVIKNSQIKGTFLNPNGK